MRGQPILGSPPFVRLGIFLARTIPRSWNYALAGLIARMMARHRNNMFCAIRANLAHVLGPQASPDTLDELARSAIEHAGRTYVDMFGATIEDYSCGRVKIEIDPAVFASTRQALRDPRGTVLVAPHMGNFDLICQWAVAQGIEMQFLGLAQPDAGTRVLHALRASKGMIITPIDPGSLRRAFTRLKKGGVVVIGIDRVVSSDDEPVLFFDAPAPLPSGHVRLALQTGAHVIVACCLQEPDGHYRVVVTPPLEMEVTGDRRRDILHNPRRVLLVVEDMIKSAPDQWLMFHPVWDAQPEP
jgi:lauroyl/myristoyl acyltransferase